MSLKEAILALQRHIESTLEACKPLNDLPGSNRAPAHPEVVNILNSIRLRQKIWAGDMNLKDDTLSHVKIGDTRISGLAEMLKVFDERVQEVRKGVLDGGDK